MNDREAAQRYREQEEALLKRATARCAEMLDAFKRDGWSTKEAYVVVALAREELRAFTFEKEHHRCDDVDGYVKRLVADLKRSVERKRARP